MTPEETKALKERAVDAAWKQFARMPSSNPSDFVHAVFREIEPALSSHPDGETEWEYGHDCDESREVYEGNPSPHNEWAAGASCKRVTSYRRRKAGPWLPVPAGGAVT